MTNNEAINRAERLRRLAEGRPDPLANPAPNDTADHAAELAEAAVERADKLAAFMENVGKPGDADDRVNDGGVLLEMPDGRLLCGCYVLLSDENTNRTLLIKDAYGRVKHLHFVKNALFIYDKHDAEQVALNMEQNPAYGAVMMKASPREAQSLVDQQATAQRQVAQSGPMTSPVTRAAEFMLQGVLQTAKMGMASSSGH